MPTTSTNKIRNIVLLGHSGSGKTIISEAMLHDAGVTTRLGTIEDGTTTSDFEPEETRRQTSVQTSIMACPWKSHKINILDTPGYADYRGEVISGLRVADGAVIVISAPAGVEVGAAQMWKMTAERNLARMIFVNKMDRENSDFQRTMDAITRRFGRECVPVNIPIGAESRFSGLVNLLDLNSEAPADLANVVDAARDRLTEAVAEADEDLTLKYLEGEEISQEEMIEGLKQGVASGVVVPVLFGSATSDIGIKELLDAIVGYMPSPAEADAVKGKLSSSEDPVSVTCDSGGPLAAFVFKTSADPFVGKLTFFKVYSGTFKADSQLWNANVGEAERVGQVFEVQGKSQNGAQALEAGDIGAVAKLSYTLTGHTLGTRDNPIVLPGIEFPTPVYRMAVYPKSKADVDKMTSSLARITEEDPSLRITRDSDTLEVIFGGLGDTHIDVAVEKMKRKFGVEMLLEIPKVPYKETIVGTTRVEYRHKKQSGGHGQFGHVWLELEPLPRGGGFEFAQTVVGGSVPREYIPSVEKGVQKALDEGVVAGFPIVDVKATLFDGSFHPVDSSGICFEIAGAAALSKGVQQASPALLEPIMSVEITVPDEFAGEIVGDLNAKRGRIQGMTPQGDGSTIVNAEAPQAELLRYATDLRSMTQGQGLFTMEFNHYEEVPQHLVQRVVEQLKERAEARA